MSTMFGTDGVRGVANTELTARLAFRLGMAGVSALSSESERPIFLIGKDTRISGDMLEDAMSAGILSMGGNVIKAGVMPTPAVAWLVRHFKADAGVVISASHNPFQYNGIKFFNGEGFKLDDAVEDEIERIITSGEEINAHISGDLLGKSLEGSLNASDAYEDFLKKSIDVDIRGMKISLDCANGAASEIAPRVFSDLGAIVSVTGNEPNGININAACGSTHPGNLQKLVLDTSSDIGFAFDGDADRLIAVDEKGQIIDGDKTIYICAEMMKTRGELTENAVTVTVMSNIGLLKALENIGCKTDITSVGDRYVLERMLQTGCSLGGEQSGHIIFLNHCTTGDGMLAAGQLLRAVVSSGKRPSELSGKVTIYPQILKNAHVKNENKENYLENDAIRAEIEEMEKRMAGDGRVLIRPSGTEPLVRVMLEGSDLGLITGMAEKLAALITRNLG
jgi:phosphoglucosamine mutase